MQLTRTAFLTEPKHQYPNKKYVFDINNIGQIFETDSPVTYLSNIAGFDAEKYTDYVGNGIIYYGGAGHGKLLGSVKWHQRPKIRLSCHLQTRPYKT